MNTDAFQTRLKELYHPATHEFSLIDVPPMSYLAIDGKGDPEHTEFERSMQWLWSIVHFLLPVAKERLGKEFAYPPLECLFWADETLDFVSCSRDVWQWRVMVVISSWATKEILDTAIAKAEEKRGEKSPASLHVHDLNEGTSLQIMHIGDYDKVQRVCENLYREFLPDNNLEPNGCYHEIYLNDPARTAPEKRKIVVRQPVRHCEVP